MKYQLFLQSRSAECGLACAAMILRRLGIDTDLHRLRTQYEVGRDGMSTTAIRFLLLDFNVPSFQHKGRVRVIGEALKQGKQVMVHVDGDHFCLVESVDSRWVRLADPGRGRVKMSREDAIRKIGRTWWIMPDAGMSTAFRRARLMCRDLRTSPSLRIVKRTLVSRPWLLLGVFALSLTLLAASGGAPLVISALVNSLEGKSAAPTQATALMLAAAIVTFIGLAVGRTLVEALLLKVTSRELSIEGIRRNMGAKLESFSTHSPGEMMYSLGSVSMVSTGLFTNGVTTAFNALTAITLLGVVAFLWPLMALVLVLVFFLLIGVFALTVAKITQYGSEEASAGGALSSQQLEIIVTMTPIRMTNSMDSFFDKWSVANERFLSATTKKAVWSGIGGATTMALTVFGPLIPLVLSTLFPDSVSDLGAVVASSGLFSVFISSVSQVFTGVTGLAGVQASIDRVDDLLHMQQDPIGTEDPGCATPITTHQASYHYPGAAKNSLDKLDFSIRCGTHNTIVGASGSGKSTFARLITGLVQPSSGSIRINGIDVADMSPEARARHIGFAPQENYLVSGTIRDNIAFGRDISDKEIWAALKITQMDSVVRELPLKLSTPVGDMGSAFSGGQRQRFALSRAIAGKPSLLVLDEATSAVDVPTERAITAALRDLNMTLISIAHRPTAAGPDDTVLRFTEDGTIVTESPDYLKNLMESRG